MTYLDNNGHLPLSDYGQSCIRWIWLTTIDNVMYFILYDHLGKGSSAKNCCSWLTFRQPEQKSCSESSDSDSEDDFYSGCRNISHQQQLLSELPSPRWSHNMNYWYSRHLQCRVLLACFDCSFFNLMPYCLLHNSWKLYPTSFNFVCWLTTLELLMLLSECVHLGCDIVTTSFKNKKLIITLQYINLENSPKKACALIG